MALDRKITLNILLTMTKSINSMNDVVNKFIGFFIKVGPNLAEKIPDAVTPDEIYDHLTERNPSSMFLKAADKN